MIDWQPISKTALEARIAQGLEKMNPAQRHLWNAVCIDPEKWQQHPYGDNGEGFWVVAIIGRTVLWYNDIEEGFNRSSYSAYGTIDEYLCNQDELEVAVQYLLTALERGTDLIRLWKSKRLIP